MRQHETSAMWDNLPPITESEFSGRTEAVRRAAHREELEAVIAYSNSKIVANVRYLTDYFTRFTGHQWTHEGYYMFGSSACLVPVDSQPLLRTDALWDVIRARSLSRYEDVDASTELGADLGEIVSTRGLKRVGIDNWYIFPARDYLALKHKAPDTEFVPTDLISDVRRMKSPAELERIRRSVRIADAAATAALDAVDVGVSEYEIGLIADEALRRMGDLENAGGAIIGAGSNSASGSSLCVREKEIEAGEWVLVDVLPKFDGYAGDIARMRLAGTLNDLDPELLHLYEATIEMNASVLEIAQAGVTPRELNERAVAVARENGVEQYKIDLVGHAVGLDIHDIPDYYWDDTPLKAGEVITVEPCLLMPGRGGTRIEDVIAIEEGGCEVMNKAPKGLLAE